jgi:2-haloacid dehalogenase
MENHRPAVILFDVNETLLDMTPLKKAINKLLGSRKGFRIWFGMLLHYSLVDNCIHQYHDFATIAYATLEMAAESLGKSIDEKEKKTALAVIKELKAYPDVKKGLRLLKENGFRLATLTNSPAVTLTGQLNNSKLSAYFDATLSIDTIKKYKPALETYIWAAEQLSITPGEIVMVAAHGWDIAGAMQAGLKAAFVKRKGQSLYPLSAMPVFMGKDLIEIANAIILEKNLYHETI